MTLKLSTAVRNARLNAIEATIGASAVLRLYTGTNPTTTTGASTGTLVAQMVLSTSWMAAASSGVCAFDGTWADTSADANGTVGCFRILNTDSTTVGIQGTVTGSTGGGDMTVDNPIVVAGQSITVTGFTLTDANG